MRGCPQLATLCGLIERFPGHKPRETEKGRRSLPPSPCEKGAHTHLPTRPWSTPTSSPGGGHGVSRQIRPPAAADPSGSNQENRFPDHRGYMGREATDNKQPALAAGPPSPSQLQPLSHLVSFHPPDGPHTQPPEGHVGQGNLRGRGPPFPT